MAEARQLAAVARKRPIKTALHQAVLDGRLHQVRLLVDKHGGDVDSQDLHGRTPLMLACMLDNEEDGLKMVRIFMRAGAYPNVKDNMNRTAIHYACIKGREEIVRIFLKDDITDIAVADNDGNTPLIHAALSGNPELVVIMVDICEKFGMKVDERNTSGYTALLLACKYGHYASAYTLLTRGHAQPLLRDNEFYLNASEWLRQSTIMAPSFACQRSHTTMAVTNQSRFSRENTMYGRWSSPVCRHVKTPTYPMGKSLDSALQLPPIFSNMFAYEKCEEHVIGGRCAHSMLLRELDEAMTQQSKTSCGQPRVSTRSRSRSSQRAAKTHPSTAKLLALTASGQTTMFPDMRTLFQLYSDQYDVPIACKTAPTARPRKPIAAT